MALYSANGGNVRGTSATGAFVCPVGTWQGNWTSRNAEVTQSDSGGCTLYRNVVQDNSWSFSCARDSVAYPEALGLAQGTIAPIVYFVHGNTNTADRLVNTLIESVSPINDNANEVGRVEVRGKGGFLTPAVAV